MQGCALIVCFNSSSVPVKEISETFLPVALLNVSKTFFDYEYLCNLFIELYFGIQEADGNIATPYKNK